MIVNLVAAAVCSRPLWFRIYMLPPVKVFYLGYFVSGWEQHEGAFFLFICDMEKLFLFCIVEGFSGRTRIKDVRR
jgi:hypothetical protein